MTEPALAEEAVLAGLQDIRLPALAPGGMVSEIFVAAGLGLLLALLLGSLLQLVTRARKARSRPPLLKDQLEEFAILPEDRRQLALLHLLKTRKPEAYAVLADRLYHADGLPECTVLEMELTRDV